MDAIARAIESQRQHTPHPISRTEATEEAAAELYAAHKTRRYDVLENKYHITIPIVQRAGFTGYFARLQQKLRGIIHRALGKTAPQFSDGQVFQLLNRLDRAKEVDFRQPENERSEFRRSQNLFAPETADVWFNLYEGDRTPFAKAVDAVVENQHIPQRYISLGTTPPALQLARLPDTQIEIQPYVLKKAMGGKHYLNPDDLKQLPAQINNPIAVLRSSTKSETFAKPTPNTPTAEFITHSAVFPP